MTVMRRRAWWALALVLGLGLVATSCEKKDDDETASEASPNTTSNETTAPPAEVDEGDETGASSEGTPGTGEALAQTGVKATHDGKALTFADAVAYPLTAEARAWGIEVSTHPMTCTTERGYRYADGEERFTFEVSPVLEKDGAMPMRVQKTYFDGMNVQGSRIEADLKRVEVGDEVIELELGSFTVKAMRDDPPIELSGTLQARRCPEPKARGNNGEAPPEPSPTDLVLVVAGQRFPIQGATVEIDEKQTRRLRLSTEPHDCEVWPGDTLAFDVALGPDDAITHLFMRGDVISTQLNDSTTIENLTASVPPVDQLTGETAEVELSGSHTMLDYEIVVEGSRATARVCKK